MDPELNPYECVMLNDFTFYNVHAKGAEIEKWCILSTKLDYVENNRKGLSTNGVQFNQIECECQNGV